MREADDEDCNDPVELVNEAEEEENWGEEKEAILVREFNEEEDEEKRLKLMNEDCERDETDDESEERRVE